jgi:hypothetical protein
VYQTVVSLERFFSTFLICAGISKLEFFETELPNGSPTGGRGGHSGLGHSFFQEDDSFKKCVLKCKGRCVLQTCTAM